jgi:ribosome biogenesis GTPase
MERPERKSKPRTGDRQFRRSGKNKRVRSRRKDWAEDAFRDSDELDHVSRERIMPRDESDRRRVVEDAGLLVGTATGHQPDTRSARDGENGIVITAFGMSARVELADRMVDCTIRGILTEIETGFTNAVAVGDRVVVSEDGVGGWVVEDVLPRRTCLTRPDSFLAPRQQVLAANVDQLLIVSSWREPDIWLELVDRYLIAAERADISPIICFNKVDLVEDPEESEVTLRPYRELGHRVIEASALTGQGLDELIEVLRDRTTLVMGLSGTGKSSLLSAVQPGLSLRTGRVREYSGQGRHTTTQSRLLKLHIGGYVVDTPGIREFGLSGVTQAELPDYFPEIAALAPGCRFSNCSHMAEPDCAVRTAEESGELSGTRIHSYGVIRAELDG